MLFYKVPEKKQKDKILCVCVCTSHVTGKDNAKDFFFAPSETIPWEVK